MKTMIEKVAQASWETWRKSKEDEGDPRADMFTFDDAWNGPEREFCIAHAKACIEAMREPTSVMIQAGVMCFYNIDPRSVDDDERLARTFHAMIDAALS